jgi:hypothetical protein
LDNGGKGFISVQELGHVLSNIGEKLSAAEIADLTKEADPEGKGIVQYEEFVKVCRPLNGYYLLGRVRGLGRVSGHSSIDWLQARYQLMNEVT